MRDIPKNRLIICKVRNLVVGDVVRDFYVKDPTFGDVIGATLGGFRIAWDDNTTAILHSRGGGSIIRMLRDGEKLN